MLRRCKNIFFEYTKLWLLVLFPNFYPLCQHQRQSHQLNRGFINISEDELWPAPFQIIEIQLEKVSSQKKAEEQRQKEHRKCVCNRYQDSDFGISYLHRRCLKSWAKPANKFCQATLIYWTLFFSDSWPVLMNNVLCMVTDSVKAAIYLDCVGILVLKLMNQNSEHWSSSIVINLYKQVSMMEDSTEIDCGDVLQV